MKIGGKRKTRPLFHAGAAEANTCCSAFLPGSTKSQNTHPTTERYQVETNLHPKLRDTGYAKAGQTTGLHGSIVRYLLLFILLVLTIPILFSIFPQTKELAYKIAYYIWNPVKASW